MKEAYKDITDRLGKPLWFDEGGVPRYVEFSPDICGSIYAREAMLIEIACQCCSKRFLVSGYGSSTVEKTFADLIREGLPPIYGDPPIFGHREGCAGGDTMQSETLRIVEFWRYNEELEWERVPALEVHFPD